jgi:hypothetical protein
MRLAAALALDIGAAGALEADDALLAPLVLLLMSCRVDVIHLLYQDLPGMLLICCAWEHTVCIWAVL